MSIILQGYGADPNIITQGYVAGVQFVPDLCTVDASDRQLYSCEGNVGDSPYEVEVSDELANLTSVTISDNHLWTAEVSDATLTTVDTYDHVDKVDFQP